MKVNKESILFILKTLDKEKYEINKIGLFGCGYDRAGLQYHKKAVLHE